MNLLPKKLIIITLALLFFISCNSNHETEDLGTDSKIFELLNSEQTGIDFQNSLDEGLNTNILMYEYFYNGGGIAAGDFNNDGLEDLYFSSNMGENKLYLNKGNLKFEDITVESGAGGRPGPWKTGVNTIDINQDGLLDIYICYSGNLPSEKRTNQLYINKGNKPSGIPIFEESASKYGLDISAYGTQSYFVDADNDQDLDMLLLNHNPKNLPLLNEEGTKQLLAKDNPEMGLRYFKNTNSKYSDHTKNSGINGSELSYGLGLAIADFNQDGWPDFYVSNDYSVPDYLYINNKNGTFSNQLSEAIGHTSQFSMGNAATDYNNDLLVDIFTLDMLPEDNKRQKLLMAPDNFAKFDLNVKSGFYYQFMRNMMHKNNGDGTFSEIGQLLGISNTDWSWAPLFADFDNDGWKDLFVSNGYYRDFTHLDFIKYMENYVNQKGRLQRQDVLEIIKQMPASNVNNYIFHNKNGNSFSDVTKSWGLENPSNSNGAVYVDLDNDGDLELITNNIGKPAFIFKNNSKEKLQNNYLKIKFKGEKVKSGIGSKIITYVGDKTQYFENQPTMGYQSSMPAHLNIGFGKNTIIDSVRVIWSSGNTELIKNVKVNNEIVLVETNAKTRYNYKTSIQKPIFKKDYNLVDATANADTINDFERQLLLTHQLSYDGPKMAKGDLNNDGLQDVVVGGINGVATKIFLQDKSGQLKNQNTPVFDTDKNFYDSDIAIFDANNDNQNDILITSGGFHKISENDPLLIDRLYLNNGKGGFTKSHNFPKVYSSKGAVSVFDINTDGSLDIFIGGRVIPGKYPLAPESAILINDGKGNFINKTLEICPELKNIGMITDAVFSDLNQDKNPELIVVGEMMPIRIFTLKNKTLKESTEEFFDTKQSGFWNKVWVGDLDGDLKPEIIVGNTGTNFQLKASIKEPINLYFGDYDNNGFIDPFLTSFIIGKKYPYVTRDEALHQLPSLKAKFTNFDIYSEADLDQLIDPKKSINTLEANTLKTTLFKNNGKFTESELPIEVQYSSIYNIAVSDFDQDGIQDILFTGNMSKTKLRFGKMDANYGCLIKGKGNLKFEYIKQGKSGLSIKNDVRDCIVFNKNIMGTLTNGKVWVYKF